MREQTEQEETDQTRVDRKCSTGRQDLPQSDNEVASAC